MGAAAGQVQSPDDLAVDSTGHVLVAEAGNARVQKFAPDGTSVLTFGGIGSADSKLGSAMSQGLRIAVGLQDDYYVASADTASVHRYRSDGSFVARWRADSFPGVMTSINGVAVLASGDVYVLSGTRVVRLSANGVYLGHWEVTDASGVPVSGMEIVGAGERLYVLVAESYESKYVVGYDAAGSMLGRWYGSSPLFGVPGSLAGVMGVGMDQSGHVLAASNHGLTMFDQTGAFLGAWPEPLRGFGGPPNEPCGLYRSPRPPTDEGTYSALDVVADGAGNVWFTEQGHRVRRLTPEPAARLDWGPYWANTAIFVAGTPVTLDASDSAVPFGSLVRYQWDFDGDGVFDQDTGANPVVTHKYDYPIDYAARVRVTASSGATAERVKAVKVIAWRPNFGTSPTVAGLPTTLMNNGDGGLACDPIEKYEWDIDGDGVFETATGGVGQVTATFNKAGTLAVGVRVTRRGGRVDTAKLSQIVYPGAPDGPLGISINGGARYTNSRDVRVEPIWPDFMEHAVISNDGGFKDSKKIPVAESIPWRLDSVKSSRLPRVVYVRFEGTYLNYLKLPVRTYQDDIILDEKDPVITDLEPVGSQAMKLTARDDLSGVDRMQVTSKKRKPGKWRKFARRVKVRAGQDVVFVRVRDAAGNASRWRRAKT